MTARRTERETRARYENLSTDYLRSLRYWFGVDARTYGDPISLAAYLWVSRSITEREREA